MELHLKQIGFISRMAVIFIKLKKMDTQQEMTKEFQPLFELMLDEHNLILTISEMEDIIIVVQKVLKLLSNKNMDIVAEIE